MKVLVACEMSARVRDAFRARGHSTWSCDLLPTLGDPAYHFQGDIFEMLPADRILLDMRLAAHHTSWDMMIAFPPCTHLSVAGAAWWKQKQADGRQQAAIDFVMRLADLPIPKIVIENPTGILSSVWRKPDQVIHPWMFGDPYQKRTCLWLKGVPPLVPEVTVPPADLQRVMSGQGKAYKPGMAAYEDSRSRKSRAVMRSMTFPGIARAMAEQWG